jgi:hypothetical protein
MRQRPKATKPGKRAGAANSAGNSARPLKRGEVPTGQTIVQALQSVRLHDLELELAALREPARIEPAARNRRRRTVDARKVFIATMKARGMSGRQICRGLDADSRKELEPLALDSWQPKGMRLCWFALWNCTDRKVRNRVRTYSHSVALFDPKAKSH